MKKKILICVLALLTAIALIWGLVYYFAVHLPAQERHAELVEAAKAYYQDKLVLYAEENAEYKAFEVDVAFIGDSLTDGYDIEYFYSDYTVENRGISGDTTHGLLARLDVSVYQLKPKVIVMLIGANNFQTMFEDYEDILIGIKENLPENRGFLSSKYGNTVENPSNCTKMPLLIWHLTKVPLKNFSKNIDFSIYIW
jgi:hypothetical protein